MKSDRSKPKLCAAALIIVAILASGSVHAKPRYTVSGAKLLDMCTHSLDECSDYLAGIEDAVLYARKNGWNDPPACHLQGVRFTFGDFSRVVVRWLQMHPEELVLPAPVAIHRMLNATCAERDAQPGW